MTVLEFRAGEAPSNSELLKGLKQTDINLILAAAKTRRFPSKSVMTHQGDPADHLLLLWKGRGRYFIETPKGKKLNLTWITPGNIFGVAALASRPSPYLTSTEAVRDSVALAWDGPTIRELARRFPPLFENAFLTSVDYLSWYVAAHCALTAQTARERLANVLWGYAPCIGQKVSGGIELDVTNEELADATNITPYTASRILSEWQRAGAIRKSHRKLILRSPETFFRTIA